MALPLTFCLASGRQGLEPLTAGGVMVLLGLARVFIAQRVEVHTHEVLAADSGGHDDS